MSQQFFLKCLLASILAGSTPDFAIAQTRIDHPSSMSLDSWSSPWEHAVLTHRLNTANKIDTIRFSPDGKLLVSVGASQITLWQTMTGEIQRILPGHFAPDLNLDIPPVALAFSPDSRFLATVTWSQGLLTPDNSLIVWDVDTGERVLELKEAEGCRQVLFDRQGEILYAACGLGVTAWSFPEGKRLFSFDQEYPLEAIALSPDGKVIATVDANITGGEQGEQSNQIQLWQLDSTTATLLKVLDGHVNDIAQIEFTPDGKRLVSSSYDGKIKVWNWQQGTIYPQTNNLYSDRGIFSLSGNSRTIAGNFHSSAMTNLVTGLPLRNVMAASNSKSQVLAFSPQGQLFAKVKLAPESQESQESQIDLWYANRDAAQPNLKNTLEDSYLSLPIAQYWNHKQQPIDSETKTALPLSIGKDPEAIALAAFGLKETVESEQEQIQLDYPQDNLALVSITQTNLGDDSIRDIRYLVKFAPYGTKTNPQWQVVWAGQQFRCQLNRGHQDWGKSLCQ